MLRLAVRLSLGGGREAIVRHAMIAVGVAVGVALLLLVISGLRGVLYSQDIPCWECSTSSNRIPSVDESRTDALLWASGLEFYNTQEIIRVDIAATGSNIPVIPGIERMPGPGEYVASPALASLLSQVPANELANRFPGVQIGEIGREGLPGPGTLSIVVGRSVPALDGDPKIQHIRSIEMAPRHNEIPKPMLLVISIATGGLLFGLMVFIGTATRLSSARREERFAALRLFGATPRQINTFAVVDSVIGAFAGSLIGLVLFYASRPLLALLPQSQMPLFVQDVHPGIIGILGVLAIVPFMAAIAAIVALRRVRLSPLGVQRRSARAIPGAWRLLLPVVGLAGMVVITAVNHNVADTLEKAKLDGPFLVALSMLVVGSLSLGSWVMLQLARVVVRRANSAALLLAARRIEFDPKNCFKPVSALATTIFICTLVASITGAITSKEFTASNQDTAHVVLQETSSLPESSLRHSEFRELQQKVHDTIPAVAITPLYKMPTNDERVVLCSDIQRISSQEAGKTFPCASDTTAIVQSERSDAFRPLHNVSIAQVANWPIVETWLHGTITTSELEQLRTLTSQHTVIPNALYGSEFRRQEQRRIASAQIAANAFFALMFGIAACSLVVASVGGLVERKRPFTLLRASGASFEHLARGVVFETAVPMLYAFVSGTILGIAAATMLAHAFILGPESSTLFALPTMSFMVVLVVGALVGCLILLSTLPCLKTTSNPHNVRFE